jgi:hypothetical protein
MTAKINAARQLYFQDMPVYFSIIPDKNFHLPSNTPFPVMDYSKMESLMIESLEGIGYIPLFSVLTLDDYYRTDTHWRQERLAPVCDALAVAMHNPGLQFPNHFEQRKRAEPFAGVLYGQAARCIPKETLYWIETEATKNAFVQRLRTSAVPGAPPFEDGLTVYNTAALDSREPYDLFLHGGVSPAIILRNQTVKTGRKLILLRDSFGSSLAPLLLQAYSEILLIDLRADSLSYLASLDLFNGVNTDVLFIYSAQLINANDGIAVR